MTVSLVMSEDLCSNSNTILCDKLLGVLKVLVPVLSQNLWTLWPSQFQKSNVGSERRCGGSSFKGFNKGPVKIVKIVMSGWMGVELCILPLLNF